MKLVALLFPVVVISGCVRNADREPLMQFLQVVERSLGHSYDENLRGCPKEERKVRWSVLFHRDQLTAIDDYLNKAPRLTERGRAAVCGVRQVCSQQVELYEAMVAEKRWEMTDAEKNRTKELADEWQRLLDSIGRMIDGKE